MKSHYYDIVRKEENNSAIWLEAAPDLNTAESRIHELSYFWPGEFQILDQKTHQIVDRIISSSDHTQDSTLAGLRVGLTCARRSLRNRGPLRCLTKLG
jgi:hypothetical protein